MFNRFFLSERNIIIAILVNAFIIFLLYFPEFHNNRFLIDFDHFFVIFYLVEAIVKLRVLKTKKYFSSRWNIFDFIIVAVSLPSLLTYFIPFPDTSFLKILRLFRLVRLVRFFKFVPNIDMIVTGLGRAMKSVFFVFIALIFLNFILALITCHFYGSVAAEYFGNPLTASYSIFQMFTVEGWHDIPATIAERMDDPLQIGAMRFYFVMVVLIGGIFGLSLANAVFVDEMTMDNNKALEEKIDQLQTQVSELKEIVLADKQQSAN